MPLVWPDRFTRWFMSFVYNLLTSLLWWSDHPGYGQTASGKTHTMFGPPGQSTVNQNLQGLVPRTSMFFKCRSCLHEMNDNDIGYCIKWTCNNQPWVSEGLSFIFVLLEFEIPEIALILSIWNQHTFDIPVRHGQSWNSHLKMPADQDLRRGLGGGGPLACKWSGSSA